MSSIKLLGPPELHIPLPKSSTAARSTPSSTAPGDSFMDLMMANFNNIKLPASPARGFTENGANTLLSTTNPCLDFFFHVVPSTRSHQLTELLEAAWDHDGLTALKLICHVRGVRGTGKSMKEGFYTAVLWLHKHHPRTLACNLKEMVQFGYFKDLLEIIYRILEPGVRETARREHPRRKKSTVVPIVRRNKKGFKPMANRKRLKRIIRRQGEKPRPSKKVRESRGSKMARERKIELDKKRGQIQKEKARELRKEKERTKACKAINRYARDPEFRFLYNQVSQVFADYLVSDMKALNSGDTKKISLAAKWCPSLDSSYDKTTLLCEAIARRVFPRESYPEYEGVEDAHYAYRVRDRLRKEVLVPLRKVLELPELYMSARKWDTLPYGRVPSLAMTNYKQHFLRHDEDRFNDFLDKVKRGEAKICAGALLPHEIISHLDDGEDDGGEVAELQWKRMVDDMSAKGKLKNCIAVCDVSDGMEGTPMDVCVSLGLLLSELSEYPWKGQVITFSENPEMHRIRGDDLRSKTDFIKHMRWGENTDLNKVFDIILKVAIDGKLSNDQMIRKVFVFSDMEFDAPTGGSLYSHSMYTRRILGHRRKPHPEINWDTNYEAIRKKFDKHRYTIPEIVFWNLRDSEATPVASDQKGVALLSGFSKNMMTMFLAEEDPVTDPKAMMELAISGPEYQRLVVLD